MIMSDLFYSLFEFSVDDISNVFNCPNRKRRAVFQDKGLTTGINVEKGSGLGHVSALFDNVYTNNTSSAYEDLTGATQTIIKGGISLKEAFQIGSYRLWCFSSLLPVLVG